MSSKTYTTTFDVHLPATKDQAECFVETIEVQAFRSFGEEVLTPESIEKIVQRVSLAWLSFVPQTAPAIRHPLGMSFGAGR